MKDATDRSQDDSDIWAGLQDLTQSRAKDNATDYLMRAGETMAERGRGYDGSDQERSMAKIVSVFNTATGLNLTELQGWAFMQALKYVRLHGSIDFHEDSAIDMIAYSALAAECGAAQEGDKAKEKDLKPAITAPVISPQIDKLEAYRAYKPGEKVRIIDTGMTGRIMTRMTEPIAYNYQDEKRTDLVYYIVKRTDSSINTYYSEELEGAE